jgi:hypothetical protein
MSIKTALRNDLPRYLAIQDPVKKTEWLSDPKHSAIRTYVQVMTQVGLPLVPVRKDK